MLFARLRNLLLLIWTFLFGGNNNNRPTVIPSKTPTIRPSQVPIKENPSPVAPSPIAPKNTPITQPIKVPAPTLSGERPISLPVRVPVSLPLRVPVLSPVKPPTSLPTTKTPTTRNPTTRAPSKVPVQTPVQPPINIGQWIEVDKNATISKRHEACFVMVKGLAYLIGGRGRKVTDVYNSRTRSWTQKAGPPIELHHMQCVAVPTDDQIYIVSSWTGGFPMERNTEFIYIYNILNDTWTTRDGLPESRRRGGAASVLVGRKIYVSHGNRGGHETGNFATSYGWLDYYNIDTNTWVTNLPDAPNPRDHTGGGLINNRYICVAGGRDGGNVGFFDLVVLPTDCFDLQTNTWSVEANISQGRAGSSYGSTCDGKYLIVAGGEGFRMAFDDVDVFDGNSWSKWDNLNIGRHGSGLAVDCTNNSPCKHQVHIASGAAGQGGGREITSVETYFPNGVETRCND